MNLSHIQQALYERLPYTNGDTQKLCQAMHYAVLGEGKRIRPRLVYATGALLGVEKSLLDGPACAVEMIHAYSLIHDDLPAMDNDELRRGQPTVHIKFDTATAILAGDALQAQAFHILATDPTIGPDPVRRAKLMATLTRVCGPEGMVGGQVLDMQSENKNISLDELKRLHSLKTGALLAACIEMATHFKPNLNAQEKKALAEFGQIIGLAFQVCDDILDVTGTTEQLGKQQGADLAHNKATYPALMGLKAAQDYAQQLLEQALAAIDGFGQQAQPLRALAQLIVGRQY